MRRTTHPLRVAAVALAAACSVARADPPGPQVEPAASQTTDEKELLAQGARALAEHKDEEALALFQKANAQGGSARSLAQMGIAEGALGRWLAAGDHLRGAIARMDDPFIKKNAAALEQALAAVEQRLGDLEVQVNVPGAMLEVDGRTIGTLPLPGGRPLRLVAGSAVVAVRAAGYVPANRQVQIVARTLNRDRVELVPLPPAPAPEAPLPAPVAKPTLAPVPAEAISAPPEPPRPKSRTGLYVGLGVGAGVLVLGAVGVGLGVAYGRQTVTDGVLSGNLDPGLQRISP